VAEPGPSLAPVGGRGPGHRYRRAHRQGAGCARAEGLRQALFVWAFNPATRDTDPPPEIAAALDWAERASLPVADLEATTIVRLALAACAKTLTGKAAAGSTQRRKRSVFYNALGYAVEQGHLPANPVDRVQWTAPTVAATVDRRVVVSPAQAEALLNAAGRLGKRGRAPEGVLCLPVLRRAAPVGGGHAARGRPAPAEGRVRADCPFGLGLQGRAGLDRRGDRPPGTRPAASRRQRDPHHPRPPVLVRLLRAHIRRSGTAPDGRIFQTARGGILQDSGYNEVWNQARKTALTPARYRSPLGRRPYDLCHAAVSLSLNSGVPATEVARRAGHGVAVLLKIYAHCIDGQSDTANKRITDALGIQDTQPESEPGDEGDDDCEQAS
jgi:hypothetical protein